MDSTVSIIFLVSLAVFEGVSGLPEPRISIAQQQIIQRDPLPISVQDWIQIEPLFKNNVSLAVLEGVSGLPEPRISIAQQQIIQRVPLPISVQDWIQIEPLFKNNADVKNDYSSVDNDSTDYKTTDFESTELGQASGFKCPRKNGYFNHEDPTNCEEFYECVDGVSILHKCPEGLKFDEFLGYCDWAFSGLRQGCGDKLDSTTAATTTTIHKTTISSTTTTAKSNIVIKRVCPPPGFWIYKGFYGSATCYDHGGTPTGTSFWLGLCCQPNLQAACEPRSCDWVGGKQTGSCSRTPITGYINTGQAECGIGCSCYVLHPRPWVVDTNTTLIPSTDNKANSPSLHKAAVAGLE